MTECNTPAVEMALGALLTQPQHLKTLVLGPSQESDLRMAACFTSLATLGLSALDSNHDFDISALQALPRLRTLSLYTGDFCIKELHERLLSLRLEDANLELTDPTTCVVPLQNLKVMFSVFSGVHSDGIVAYTTLQELYLHSGSIDGSYTSDDSIVEFGGCGRESYSCPDLSLLKFLRVLYMNVSLLPHDEPIDWVCLYCLSSLQALTLHSTSQGLNIDEKLTMLDNLTSLKLIGASSPYAFRAVVSVAMNVSWGATASLQNIYVESDRLQFGSNMLELLQVSNVKHVTFLSSKHVTVEQPANFAALVQGLMVQRPGSWQCNVSIHVLSQVIHELVGQNKVMCVYHD